MPPLIATSWADGDKLTRTDESSTSNPQEYPQGHRKGHLRFIENPRAKQNAEGLIRGIQRW
ncbi:hypothetical protein OIDMADRAFT_16259 [Oidiodendron maius Zn]|uniref:Uncharacterized protein n=1 Tax=Oidiodendron maius (strain Zn) TaxID=913774 RepID=A0A0C3D8P1_OIDMZ|nr:hypothetical protein OIDMADRAFT_16259 [Oidiodendron maius Zn]